MSDGVLPNAGAARWIASDRQAAQPEEDDDLEGACVTVGSVRLERCEGGNLKFTLVHGSGPLRAGACVIERGDVADLIKALQTAMLWSR